MATQKASGQAAILKKRRQTIDRRKKLAEDEELQEAAAALAFQKLDKNNDGIVDMKEYVAEKTKATKEEAIAHKVTADGDPEELSGKEMIAKLEEKLRLARANRYNYLNLVYFLCYVSLYLFVLTEQRSTLTSFEVEEALKISIFSEKTNTLELYSGEISENLDSVAHIWSWINRSLIHSVFTDPICGDGTCDVPQEFEQWESYGCAEDCGSVPRSKMTNVFVEVTAHFESDAELNAASWNLCSQTHDLCFYPIARKFVAKNETQLVETWLPDGVWEITVDASNGGVTGRVYTENSTTITYYRNITETLAPTISPKNNATITTPLNSTNNATAHPKNSTNSSISLNLTNSTDSVPLSPWNLTNITIVLNSTNSTATATDDTGNHANATISRTLEDFESDDSDENKVSPDPSLTNLTTSPSTSAAAYVLKNASNSTLSNLTNMTYPPTANISNLTNTSLVTSPTPYNGTEMLGNRTNGAIGNMDGGQNATSSSNSTGNENSTESSNATIRNSSSTDSGSSNTNSSVRLVLVTEVLKVQTDILSWDLCKDATDSTVDHIFEHINRTVLPKCQQAGVVHEICSGAAECPRCAEEFNCLSHSCGWDQTTAQCYNKICSNSKLQCQECTDESSCETAGCLFDTPNECLYGCEQCSNCTQQACGLKDSCYWDGSASECKDVVCDQFNCTLCDESLCNSFPGWCEWDIVLGFCEQLYCETNHCDRPRCNDSGVCDATVGCSWDSSSSACLEIVCNQTDCSSCDEFGCASLPGWCEWDSGLGSCEQLNCETGHCDRPRCKHSGVCDSTVGCIWNSSASICSQFNCDQSDCSLCDENGCDALPGWCQWDSGLATCEQLYCESNHCDRPHCLEAGICSSTVGCSWDASTSTCSQFVCDQSDCSLCDQSGCDALTGWCQWDSGLGLCWQLYCDINHCDRLMCYEPGECENTYGCTWDATSSTCFKRQVFLPFTKTVASVDTSIGTTIQIDQSFLTSLDAELLEEYGNHHNKIQNNINDVQVVATFQLLETGFVTLTPNTGTTFTASDLQDFADAFRNARCGGMPEDYCKLESITPLHRRQLSDQDLEVTVDLYVSTEFFTEKDKLSLTDLPLPATSSGFLTRLGAETTSFPGSFVAPVMTYEVTMTVLTNLDEGSTNGKVKTELNYAAAETSIFTDALTAETGVTSPIVGTIDVDLCGRRDCSGHGTCSGGSCSCTSGWSETHCNYNGGQLFSQTTSNPTASSIGINSLDMALSSEATRSPSLVHLESSTRSEALRSVATESHMRVQEATSQHSNLEADVGTQPGDPVATTWMDIKPAALEGPRVVEKVTAGIWEVLLKDKAIVNNKAIVFVSIDVEQTRSYSVSRPDQYVEGLHKEKLLTGIRDVVCGAIPQESCDVYYPSAGSQEIAMRIRYPLKDFKEPIMFPDKPHFSDHLEIALKNTGSVAWAGYTFKEDSVTARATIEFYVVNESASRAFIKRVQSAAESHADIIREVKAALDWSDLLLRSTGAMNTDLCNKQQCSGRGYCSKGECICNSGFFGLSCSLSTRRRQLESCLAELECVFCYDATECDALPSCRYDWSERLCMDVGSLNKEETPFTAACVSESTGDCEERFVGNGLCDSACNIPSCGYDGGDCPDTANLLGYLCSDFCYCNMLNDQVCNRECNNALCGFDLGDCCVKTFTKRLTRQFELWTSSTPETVERLTPDPTVPRLRYLATTNRLIAGILLNQKRRSLTNCTDLRFPNLSKSGCFDGTHSQEPYGADPVFLRNTSLSNEALSKYAFYDPNDPSEVSSLGVPYGFHHVSIEGFEKDAGFPLFFDVNFGYDKGQDILNYGREGFYLDDQTSLLTIQAVTYNPHYKLFASIEVDLEFETGGRIRMRYDVQSIRVDMYSTPRDHRRFLAELVFLGATAFDAFLKLKQLVCWKWKGKTISGYFVSIWNYIDLLNILLMAYLALTWVDIQTKHFAAYSPKERFDVYSNINANARFLQFNEEELQQMLRFFSDTKSLANLLSTYVTGSACALVLLIIRLLEVLDFQERMGIVTRTITNAVIDLLHWLILFGIIFFLYVYMGFLIFGTAILSFSTIERSFQTCFGILLGEIGVTEEMFNLPNKASVYIFYYTFIMIVFFVLINVFLAIIVDAYVDVKNQAENSESLPREVFVLSRSLIKSLPCFRIGGKRYVDDSEIIRVLDEWLDEERTLTAIPEPQGSLDLDGYHLTHGVLSDSLSEEMAKLKVLRKSHQMKQTRKRRQSIMMNKVLKESESERQLVNDLSSRISDNIIHRYGKGFKRLQRRSSSIKVRPSIFAGDFRRNYRATPHSGHAASAHPSAEQTLQVGASVTPRVRKTKVEVPMSTILQRGLKEESLDSLDQLLDAKDLDLK